MEIQSIYEVCLLLVLLLIIKLKVSPKVLLLPLGLAFVRFQFFYYESLIVIWSHAPEIKATNHNDKITPYFR